MTKEKRDIQYSRKCKRCRSYPATRSIVFNTPIWIHDSVHPCKAAELREKHWKEDHPEEQ